MSIFKCKMCGGTLEVQPGTTVAVCEYCGTKQTLPKLDDDRRANLYDRANHFRRNNEFDKASGIYNQILNEDSADAEAYWSLVLCRYGIEYVEDPATRRRVPTVNRAQFTSIFDDADYKSALQYADAGQCAVYEDEAKAINEIQKGILAISQKEEPFDVFICYKETDANGRRTPDSVLANDLYHQLTQEGFKVFFSRITLEDKLGTAYEPYIFAALNSAKVMVALGTKPEYFNAVWVKNEWGRYLALIKNGAHKVLIPAYKDMDPYDLPEEFSHLQAQDMGKLGFMQDLIRGIKKLAQPEAIRPAAHQTVAPIVQSAGTAPLLRRAFLFLEDGDWKSASEYCEKVLDLDPECAEAYLGKLMAELNVHTRSALADCNSIFDERDNYKKAMRFGGEAIAAELNGTIAKIKERKRNEKLEQEQAQREQRYSSAVATMNQAKTEIEFREIAVEFSKISDYKDSAERNKLCLEYADIAHKKMKEQEEIQRQERIAQEKVAKEKRKKAATIVTAVTSFLIICIAGVQIYTKVIVPGKAYQHAVSLIEEGNYLEAYEAFVELGDFRDSAEKTREAKYARAMEFVEEKQYDEAYDLFISLQDFKDSIEQANNAEYLHATMLMENERYEEAYNLFLDIRNYKNSADQIDSILNDLLPEQKYKKAMETEENGNIASAAIQYAALNHYKDSWEKTISLWELIAERNTISAAWSYTVGLRANGTVVSVGGDLDYDLDFSDWMDIISISAGKTHTVGLCSDGTVVAIGNNEQGQCDVSNWADIVAISAGNQRTVGLHMDGTVVATGYNYSGQCDVSGWTDIVAVSAGYEHTVGLRADGKVVATGSSKNGERDVSKWTNIVAVSAGKNFTIGLHADGTVVAVGKNSKGQCGVSQWTNVIAISAGSEHTVGLRADGTVVATGSNTAGQCNTSEWDDIVAICAGDYYTIGLRANGTTVAVGANGYGQCDVSGWSNIKLPLSNTER